MAIKPSEKRKLLSASSEQKYTTPEQEAQELEKKYKNKQLGFFAKLARKRITYEDELTVEKDQNPIFLSKRDVYVNRAIQVKLIKWLVSILLIVNSLIFINIGIETFKREPDFYTVEQNAKILCADVYVKGRDGLVKDTNDTREEFCEELRKAGGFK